MTKKEIAVNAVHALKKEYPDAICSLVYTDPLQLLIATRLAAQCTDARVNMVTPSLFDRFKTAQDFADSTPEEVAEYIKSCFFKNKILPKEELRKIINNFKISSDDAEILFARMLFPTFYFDLFQQNVTTDSIDSSAFNKIIASIEQYKMLLNNIYDICFDQNKRTFYIDWILIDR